MTKDRTMPKFGFVKKYPLALGVLAALFLPALAFAKPAPLTLDKKIHNLEAILSKASRGKMDEAELTRIWQLLEDAEIKFKAGDTEGAEKQYSEAWAIYKAASKVTQAQNHQSWDDGVFAAKINSIRALLKQLEAIDGGSGASKTEQIENIKSLLAQAESSPDPAKALAIANQAYYTTKIVLKDVRSGKRLTVDHTYSTKEMKYADEHAYNEAHFGLLDTALEQLHAKADAEYNQSIDKARKLRELAEEEAEQKSYDSAIRDIILSTREIMKALKHIGLPVPGMSLQE